MGHPRNILEGQIEISPKSCPATDNGSPSHHDSLVAIHSGSIRGGSKYCLFVQARTLLSYVHDTPDAVGRVVPWTDWGPGSTCLVTDNERRFLPSEGTVRGMRYLWHDNDDHVARLWDFYPSWTRTGDDGHFLGSADNGEYGQRGHQPDGKRRLSYTEHQILPPELQTPFPVYFLFGEDSIVAIEMVSATLKTRLCSY
ncbi:hypothetical protein BV25DRAFT_1164011 [Artomyces pyxidatus]|uniref:Uncharacterized protein n=1 Tax=Artomyces pyxidatus TaxID=48021 RepID=A0ACB8SSV3_9AGAM|nr:hypothetical protein BV25DRAFT_1164011 [Artomyces pyxidatus]